MELLGVLISLLLVSTLIVLPIVTVIKLSIIRSEISELKAMLRPKSAPKPAPAPEPVPELAPAPESVSEPEPVPEPESVSEPEPAPSVALSGVELFQNKVSDWLCVRGDFAPAGMTREFAFATRWLVRIGVLLIVGSLIYFVKLSIERGWMGPTGRVAMMLFWGAVACVAGVAMVKRTSRFGMLGHAVAALGIVALYLGFGLGHRYFDPPVIASPVFAFAALAAVTFVAWVMSVYLPSAHIAVMALAGGYLVPLVAGRDSGFPLGLDLYLLVLNLGAFFVARKRRWSVLDFLAAALAYGVCFAWGAKHSGCGSSALAVNFAFMTVVHALYMASVVIGSQHRSAAGNSVAWSGLALNACVYFAWIASVFRPGFSERITGLVVLALVALYAMVAKAAIASRRVDRPTVNVLLVFALAFLAASPMYLFHRAWCVVIWSAIAVAASEGDRRIGQRALGVMSFVILGAAALKGIVVDAPQAYDGVFRHAMSVSLPAGDYLRELALRLVRLWSLPLAAAFVARHGRVWLRWCAIVLAFGYFTCEAKIFGAAFLPSFGSGTVTLAWALLAFAALFAGIMRQVKCVRIAALWLLGVTVVKLLFFDTAHLPVPSRVMLFAATGVTLLVGAFLYLRFQQSFADSTDGKELK